MAFDLRDRRCAISFNPDVGLGLLSTKPAEALHLELWTIPVGLRLGALGRTPNRAAIRSAAISVTQLALQRAALELDIDPDEFEALEPRVRNGLPLIQIADKLVNEVDFCRRLAESESNGGAPIVVRLVRSMLDVLDDPIVTNCRDAEHCRSCAQAGYRWMQRYGNRQYHGFLGRRLGLGVLRAMLELSYRSGLDGDWKAGVELYDWPRTSVTTSAT